MENIIYSRVSTNAQGPESLDVQNAICLNQLNSNGMILNNSYSEITSAYNGKQATLEKIINQKSNANVFIKNVSRFSRNVVYGTKLIEDAKKKNIYFYFVDENLNTYNDTHRHLITTKISEAQAESETISRRARDSYKVKKAKGWRFGKMPYGYKSSLFKGVRKMEKNNDEKKVIDFIVQARTGTSAKLLNSKLKKIVSNPAPIYFYDEEGKVIDNFSKPNTLRNDEVADLLNDYHIKKRNREWTASSVKNVFDKEIKLEMDILKGLDKDLKIN
tara:strand:+ start:114 stop:935 length:822 start_codon:yes stop_codon:yes gene_type:complete